MGTWAESIKLSNFLVSKPESRQLEAEQLAAFSLSHIKMAGLQPATIRTTRYRLPVVTALDSPQTLAVLLFFTRGPPMETADRTRELILVHDALVRWRRDEVHIPVGLPVAIPTSRATVAESA